MFPKKIFPRWNEPQQWARDQMRDVGRGRVQAGGEADRRGTPAAVGRGDGGSRRHREERLDTPAVHSGCTALLPSALLTIFLAWSCFPRALSSANASE